MTDEDTLADTGLTYREKLEIAVHDFEAALTQVPDSRAKSIAKTHLETAQLWALKAAE